MTELALAVVAGALIGLSLGALGGGGSILAVPVLLALGQSPTQATTGSLVVGILPVVRVGKSGEPRERAYPATGQNRGTSAIAIK